MRRQSKVAAKPRLEPRAWRVSDGDSAMTGITDVLVSAVQVALSQVTAQGSAILAAQAVIKHGT